ncbi:transcription termination/antitermination protein NusG [Falsiroseomonas tokyonensis]|uniref:Transcription termination/antitermination protein NusG n=1 Tax=Falsiroseomonas tokyonensis TaxID=430521 RepID=A0ABV7C0P2_9PROT|nr:transcription termination/antitermination NusG family protein [Falsiroseomonas tokyonensis]MBU8540827.1 hypothetical protein [Falsiroseomonas tokyonensis]
MAMTNSLDLLAASAADPSRGVWIAAGQAGATPPIAGPSSPARSERQQLPSLLPLTPNWIVIHHRADDGARVRIGVRREGFEVHWPRIIDRRPRKDDVIRPFFPGYMFACAIEPHASWHALRSAVPNLIAVMGVPEFGRPVFAPPGFVEALITKAGSIGGVIEPVEDTLPAWRRGQPVQISGGYLDGFKGLYQHDKAGDRVVVLLEIMGRQASVTVDRKDVAAQPAADRAQPQVA